MILFSDEKVIGLFGFDDIAGRILLGVEGVSGHDGTFERQGFEQFGEFGDFVGFFMDRDLADDHGFLVEDGAEQVGWGLSCLVTATYGFSVHGHGTPG